MKISVADIARMLGAPAPVDPQNEIGELLTDSRSLIWPRASLFFALKGAGTDGHRFVTDLYRRGVRNFVVTHIPDDVKHVYDANFFIVPDTLKALQSIGAMRRGFAGEILAIGGSQGKTTLKEWIFRLMEHDYRMARSPRSYNSQIGVPLSLWKIEPSTQLAVIEAGVSRTGEMRSLAEIIKPDMVVLTNIGPEHADGFASLAEKASEKALLAAGPEVKTVVYCADYPLLHAAVQSLPSGKRIVGWSRINPDAPLFISKVDGKQLTYVFEGLESAVTLPSASPFDVENAINALAVMLLHGMDRDVIASRFAALGPVDTRLNVSEGVNNCIVVYDSYTSDFSSLDPALDFMKRRLARGQSQTIILSDLRHESLATDDLYARIAALVKARGINRFIGVGPELTRYGHLFPEGSRFFKDSRELFDQLSTSDFDSEVILLKGAPEFDFREMAERLEARKHETVLEVNLDAIVTNFNYFRRHLPKSTGLIAMVKASAYGAGSYEVAKTMQDHGAAYLAVAVLDEGIDLRQRGITMPIMVMNPKVVNYKSMFAFRLEPEIYSMSMLHDVIREAAKNDVKAYPVHIKLDTGMHRMGFIEEELPELMDVLESQDRVVAHSVFSHLATADCPDLDDYTHLQLSRFKSYTDYMLSRSSHPILRHVLNSAGILRFPEHHYDMARLGIGLYGVDTLPPDMEEPLAVVSSLRTVIIAVREWQPGETIGYGRKGKITRPSRIATIPIGYADGMNRHFGNGNICVKVNGKDAPTIGNICMDACMIDVTGIDCREGDEVEIFGREASIHRLADVLQTIPYEILTSVSPRVKRIYYRE